MKKMYALRGAVRCDNTKEDICKQVNCMYDELLLSNMLDEKDIVSVMFTVTEDVNVLNPCTALRQGGRAGESALFCSQEPKIIGSLERVIRVIVHCYLKDESVPVHVYRNGAEVLRPDRVTLGDTKGTN